MTFENMVTQANEYLKSLGEHSSQINSAAERALWEAFNDQLHFFERQYGGPLMNFPVGLKLKDHNGPVVTTQDGQGMETIDGIPITSIRHPGVDPESLEEAEIELPDTPHNINCKKLEILGKLADSLNNIAIQISKLEFWA